MRAHLAYIRMTLRLTMRDRLVLFFNYLFPLGMFALFASSFGADKASGAVTQVVSMVLVLGILGGGFFGGGMRAVMEREAGILRRFKVAPITPSPVLVSSMVVGWVTYMPSVAMFYLIANYKYGMPLPERWAALLVFITVGIVSFRAVGLIVASVVNTMAESQLIVQLLYLPMLMLSGATFPLTMMPRWLQMVSQFLPSTHLYLGMQNIMVRGESLQQNWASVGALALTGAVSLFISIKLFRWEKEEKIRPRAKLWILAVLAPFLLIGAWQLRSQENLAKTKMIEREQRRGSSFLIKDARLFLGDGRVVEQGAVLVRDGRIAEIYEGAAPGAKELKAYEYEAAGKTVLPGLIDLDVRLMMPGAVPANAAAYDPAAAMPRALAAYLYSGVTAIASVGDPPQLLAGLLEKLKSGEELGPEVFTGAAQPPSRVRQCPGADLFSMPLLLQVLPPAMKDSTLARGRELVAACHEPAAEFPGVLATGSGIPPLVHGPMIHREMQRWVKAGVPAGEVLLAATSKAAQRLGIAGRAGAIRKGYEANLIVVEGNPLADIAATERLYLVVFKGERIDRGDLFADFDKK